MEEKYLSNFKKISLGVISASFILAASLTGFAASDNSAVVLPELSETKPVYDSADGENDIVLISSDVLVSTAQIITGSVTGINKPDSTFTLKVSDSESISFDVSESTCWVDAKTGLGTSAFDSLSLSDSVSVYYEQEQDSDGGSNVKNNADVVFINLEKDAAIPYYIEVAFTEETDKGLGLTSKYGASSRQLDSDAEVVDYTTGEKLSLSAVSSDSRLVIFPAFSDGVQKVLLLGDSERENLEILNVISDEESGIYVEGTDYVFGEGEDIIAVNDKIYLPVRVLANAAGYDVEWIEETSSVRLTRGNFSVFFTIDSTDVGVNKSRFILGNAPVIVGVKTYVPVDLFEKVLGIDVRCDGTSASGLLEE